MKHQIAGAMLALLLLAATPGLADDLKKFHCGFLLKTQGGLPQLVGDDHLYVLAQTSANAKFDPARHRRA